MILLKISFISSKRSTILPKRSTFCPPVEVSGYGLVLDSSLVNISYGIADLIDWGKPEQAPHCQVVNLFVGAGVSCGTPCVNYKI